MGLHDKKVGKSSCRHFVLAILKYLLGLHNATRAFALIRLKTNKCEDSVLTSAKAKFCLAALINDEYCLSESIFGKIVKEQRFGGILNG